MADEEKIDKTTEENAGDKAVDIKVEGADEDGAEKAAEKEQAPETEKDAAAGKPEEAEASDKDKEDKKDNKKEKDKKESGAKETGKDNKSFFKKKKDKKDEKIDELTDRLQRNLAEFDNFRKRTEKEKASMFDMGARDVIEKMLPVVDNFERGLKNADLSDPFADGMNKVYKQLLTVLEDLDVKPIEAEGKEFDPNLHNAVMHEDNPDVGENIITQELQKGYTYKDTVVRHSMVKVAN